MKYKPCDEWVERLTKQERDLPFSERAALQRHLESCPDCAAAYRDKITLSECIRTLPAPNFPAGLSKRMREVMRASPHRTEEDSPPVGSEGLLDNDLLQAMAEKVSIDETLSSRQFNTGEIYMLHENEQSESHMRAVRSNTVWSALYPALRSLASYLVHTSPLPYWYGQEDDMVEDIVQETVRRVIESAQKAERGEADPIQSLKQMATTVAYNYYRDLKRHDYRLSRLDTTDASTYTPYLHPADVPSDEHLLDVVADKVDQDRLLDMLAGEIARFPPKQRQAILRDLANRMAFDEEPTPLQQSFLNVGIELRSYRQPLPDDPRERGRYISLCSQAYKRIAYLLYAHQRV